MDQRCKKCGQKIPNGRLANAARVAATADYCGGACRNAAKQARHRERVPVSAQDRIHLRNLVAHGMIAEKMLRDPSVIALARENLRRWIARRGLSPAFSEWREILDAEPRAIAAKILAVDEDGMRLRSSSPFVGILNPSEFELVYKRRRA